MGKFNSLCCHNQSLEVCLIKQSLLSTLAVLLLLSTGCASLLNQEYLHVSLHTNTVLDTSDPSILRAENYQELVNALVYFISLGTETGRIRLYMESERIESHLEAACLEVVQEDPLGAYAVDFIKYSVKPLVAYSEADVTITYRRTREQIASITSATGTLAIRSELEQTIADHASECTLRIGHFDGDEAYLQQLVQEAYWSEPLYALDKPEAEVFLYPDQGQQRIVEIVLRYQLSQSEWLQRKEQLEAAQTNFLHSLRLTHPQPDSISLAQTLIQLCNYHPSGGATAYHAFTQGSADSEGLALAQLSLCKVRALPCYLVSGTWNGIPHCWNIIQTPEGYRHLDLTRSDPNTLFLCTDDEARDSFGYQWEENIFPPCSP